MLATWQRSALRTLPSSPPLLCPVSPVSHLSFRKIRVQSASVNSLSVGHSLKPRAMSPSFYSSGRYKWSWPPSSQWQGGGADNSKWLWADSNRLGGLTSFQTLHFVIWGGNKGGWTSIPPLQGGSVGHNPRKNYPTERDPQKQRQLLEDLWRSGKSQWFFVFLFCFVLFFTRKWQYSYPESSLTSTAAWLLQTALCKDGESGQLGWPMRGHRLLPLLGTPGRGHPRESHSEASTAGLLTMAS